MINKAVCGPECKCNKDACKNTLEHPEERLEAIAKILISREKAFDEKHFKGCKCEKSACQLNYCECFERGLKCTDQCKCKGCKNGKCNDEKCEKESIVEK